VGFSMVTVLNGTVGCSSMKYVLVCFGEVRNG